MPTYEETRRSTKGCLPAEITTPASVTGIRQYDSTVQNTFLNLRFPPYLLPTQNTMAIIRKFDKTHADERFCICMHGVVKTIEDAAILSGPHAGNRQGRLRDTRLQILPQMMQLVAVRVIGYCPKGGSWPCYYAYNGVKHAVMPRACSHNSHRYANLRSMLHMCRLFTRDT